MCVPNMVVRWASFCWIRLLDDDYETWVFVAVVAAGWCGDVRLFWFLKEISRIREKKRGLHW